MTRTPALNLYAMLSDSDGGYDTYAALVVAETRGKARYAFWREFAFGEAFNETRYVCRLAAKDVEGPARVIAEKSAKSGGPLWVLAEERTGIYQRSDE